METKQRLYTLTCLRIDGKHIIKPLRRRERPRKPLQTGLYRIGNRTKGNGPPQKRINGHLIGGIQTDRGMGPRLHGLRYQAKGGKLHRVRRLKMECLQLRPVE